MTQFAVAKASAYSSILTFFPALLVVGSVLATSEPQGRLPARSFLRAGADFARRRATAIAYLRGTNQRPVGLLISTSLITLWTASGTMISWMEGFRHAYAAAQSLGAIEGTLIAFSLVIMAGIPLTFATVMVAFGISIETRILFHIGHEFGPTQPAVDGDPLDHRHPDQHRRDRADLSQCRAAHAALAQRAARAPRWLPRMWFLATALFGCTCTATPTTASSTARWALASRCWCGCT